MTTLADFSFVIDNSLGTIHVNAIGQPLGTSTLAANVYLVQFDGNTSAGQITYNDRPPLPEQFTDPSPYQTYINNWIAATAGLTLAQAQAVKCGLINSIYGVKRQQPVNVTVSAGNHNWDASDQAMARLAALSPFVYIGPVNTLIGTINSEMASLISSLNADVTDTNGIETVLSSFRSSLQTNLNSWVSNLNTTENAGGVAGWTNPGNMTVPTLGSMTTLSSDSFSSLSTITPPTMNLLPVGGTSNVSLTPADVSLILQAIATQNAKEALANATKQAAVNALTAISDVIAYDATTGW